MSKQQHQIDQQRLYIHYGFIILSIVFAISAIALIHLHTPEVYKEAKLANVYALTFLAVIAHIFSWLA